MKRWLCVLLMMPLLAQGQTYWQELDADTRERMETNGRITPQARGYFNDATLSPADSAVTLQLLQEIGNSPKELLPFYWQLLSQLPDFPAGTDSVAAAASLFNLVNLHPDFIINYYQLGYDQKLMTRYVSLLSAGYMATPWLYPNTPDLRQTLKKQVSKDYRKGIKVFIEALEEQFSQ